MNPNKGVHKFQVTVVKALGHDVLEARAKAEAEGWTVLHELSRVVSTFGTYVTFTFEVTKEINVVRRVREENPGEIGDEAAAYVEQLLDEDPDLAF